LLPPPRRLRRQTKRARPCLLPLPLLLLPEPPCPPRRGTRGPLPSSGSRRSAGAGKETNEKHRRKKKKKKKKKGEKSKRKERKMIS
jgi:hypothetical protein